MFNSGLPLEGLTTEEAEESLRKIKTGKYVFANGMIVTELGQNFLKSCLQPDVNDRITWE